MTAQEKIRDLINFCRNNKDDIDVFAPLFVSLLSLALGILAVYQTTENIKIAKNTAIIARNTALSATMPKLQYKLDFPNKSITLKNYGPGAAIIYFASFKSKSQSYTEPENNVDEVAFDKVLNEAFSETFTNLKQPESRSEGLRRVLASGEELVVLKIEDDLTPAQLNELKQIHKHLKVDVCYANLTADMAFGARLSAGDDKPECPQPPKDLGPEFPDDET